METVSEIQKMFLKNKLKDLELGVRFTKAFKEKMGLTIEEFLQEFDSANTDLNGCGKKELNLFRFHLEAHGVDWHTHKIKRLFMHRSFRKGVFLKTNKLKSEDFTFVYQYLHKKRIDVESVQQLELF